MTRGQYGACRTPACLRKVSLMSLHCCATCSVAHEDGWDPDGAHSVGCEQRAAERGEWTPDEATLIRVFGA